MNSSVDASGLVGLEPRNGVGNPGQRDRGGTADDAEARVLAAGERRAHLPTASSIEISLVSVAR